MPYSEKAHRLFEGIKHGTIPEKDGLTKEKAATLASEGVKKDKSGEATTRSKAAKPRHERMYKDNK